MNRRFTGRKNTHANGRSHRADQRHPHHLEEAEEDNALVFRFYEFECRDSEVRLVLPEAASRAAETNLLEREARPLELSREDREIRLPIGHHEITSIKVEFPHSAGGVAPHRG